MKAMFSNAKAFAVFNSKPNLFSYGEPYQLGTSCANSGVYIEPTSGSAKKFEARVEQFGGVILSR